MRVDLQSSRFYKSTRTRAAKLNGHRIPESKEFFLSPVDRFYR